MPRLPLLAVPLLADGAYMLASKWWSRRARPADVADDLEGSTPSPAE